MQLNAENSIKPGTVGYRAPEITLGEFARSVIVYSRSLLTSFIAGLPWSFEVDQFGIGCVLAEATMLSNLFDGDCESDREYLALVDRIVGPFPEDYAQVIERAIPGTFSFNGRVKVLYPAHGAILTRQEHLKPVLRIERARPLSVRRLQCLLSPCLLQYADYSEDRR